MANKVYYKLGENAAVFYDPSTRILITGKEVIELEKTPKSKKFNMAKAGGHIVMTSKTEFDEYQATLDPENAKPADETTKAPVVPENPKGKKVNLTPEEVALKKSLEKMEDNQAIIDYFRGEGFLDEDLDKLTEKVEAKKSELINLAIELNREYK